MAKKSVKLKVRLVLVHKYRLLMLKQRRSNGGNYTLPGGSVEKFETPKTALLREVAEESGLQLQRKDLVLVHVLHKYTPRGPRINLYFRARSFRGTPRNLEPHKFSKLSWEPYDQLPRNTTETVLQALRNINRKIAYSQLHA